jgi:D-amino-acid oxidase
MSSSRITSSGHQRLAANFRLLPAGRAIERRLLLKAAVATIGAGFAPACAARSAPKTVATTHRSFAPVYVSRDRIIRTVVGLRPFRPSGFVVKGEKLDQKTVIHNYGHGGGGVTLSWGTSHLAVEEAMKTGQTKFAVIGSGAVGLATARLLQKRGGDVTIYAKDLPPATTSNIAGAQWSPYSVFDADKQTPEFKAQFERASRLSNRYFQDLVGDVYGVRWIENYACGDTPPAPSEDPLQDLFRWSRDLEPGEHPFPARYVHRFVTMLVEPPIYLMALTRDFLLAGGKVVVREFQDVPSVLALPEPVIMNCTGLGAHALFGDQELTPIKGQLTILLPQPEVDYIVLGDDRYMFPRRDGILLGGTHERGEWSLEPNLEAMERILAGHMRFFQDMKTS